jgi:hypothetical protein
MGRVMEWRMKAEKGQVSHEREREVSGARIGA